MVQLETKDQSLLLQILSTSPVFATERGREAVLVSAGLEKLLPILDLSGSPVVAVALLLKNLSSFGRVDGGQEALGQFLSATKSFLGVEQQDLIDIVIRKYGLVGSSKSDLPDWKQPVTAKEVTEKIIGEMTLRPIAFLSQALRVSRSVAYVEISHGEDKWSGTGFLVSSDLFLTCNHVINQSDILPNTVIRFNFQHTFAGNPEIFKDFVPATIVRTNKALDYTLLRVSGTPGAEWGYLKLSSELPVAGSRVNIIQHPNGLPKQVSLQNNFVRFLDSRKIQYVTATMPGSSGAPVFNDNWDVIGLHRAGGWLPEVSPDQLYFRNEGTTIAAILEDLPDDIRTQFEEMN